MKLLDLSKFEKVGEDKDTTRMRHKDGHEMIILHAKLPKIHREQLRRLKMAHGGSVAHFDEGGKAFPAPTPNKSPDEESASPKVSPVPSTTSDAQVPQSESVAPTVTPLQQQAQGILSAQQQQAAGARGQALVEIEKAKDMAPLFQEQVKQEEARKQLIQNNINSVKSATDSYNDWMAKNGTPNPDHFLQSQDAATKVATALGLIIGGFTGGASGRNQAMDWLKDQQEKDIAAQASAIDSKKSVLSGYQQLFNNGNAAIEAARISDNHNLQQQAQQIANRLGTPQAWANYNALIGKLNMENDIHTQNAAGYLSFAGAPSATGTTPGTTQTEKAGATKGQTEDDGSILVPGAGQKFMGISYTQKGKEDFDPVKNQLNQATQADKSLARLDEVFDRLHKNEEEGGVFGNLRRRGVGAVGGLPMGIGSAIAGGLRYATDTNANVMYDANLKDLIGMISGALKGTNIGGDQIHDIAVQNAPERGDTPEMRAQKKKNIRDFIISHTETSLLKPLGLSKR